MISGTPVERVSSFKYLGVNISEDLTWTAHIQTQVKKARQRLYHLRQLRKFRVSPAILKTFYSGAIESVLTQCISVWYGNSSNQDCKAMQRVVRLAEHISGSALPSLQDIYFKHCKSRAAKIIKDSNHPGNHFFISLPSGKRFRSMMAKTERLLFAHSSCTSLFILIFINPQYTVLHILSHCTFYSFYFIICSYFYSHLYLYIFSCVMFHCFILIFFALSIERTCPDLHFTTDYTLYDCVCDE